VGTFHPQRATPYLYSEEEIVGQFCGEIAGRAVGDVYAQIASVLPKIRSRPSGSHRTIERYTTKGVKRDSTGGIPPDLSPSVNFVLGRR
jgi:hypothetical protein